MKKIITTLLLSASVVAVAQESGNLVPNSSFEETDKDRVKEKGQIELAQPWNSPTTAPADLYMERSKSDEYGVPNNTYGEEKAKSGSNYAGISFYGHRRETRSYLQVELLDTLEAGKEYCMKFHVSMADKAKYAVNNLAMYISNQEVESKGDDPLKFEPQIMNIRNRVFNKQFLWEAICGTYTAKGDETHIVIGNFNSDEQTAQEKIRMSRDMSGRQMATGYYYIDDVSVVPVNEENREDCMCSRIAGGGMKVQRKTFGTEEEKRASAKTTVIVNSDGSTSSENEETESATEKTENETEKQSANAEQNTTVAKAAKESKPKAYSPNDVILSFDLKSPKLNEDATTKLDKLIEYLNKNKDAKVEIQGHADVAEESVPFLGKRRAFAVVKYLTDQGINRDQIPYKSFETEMPAETGNPEANARVTFLVK